MIEIGPDVRLRLARPDGEVRVSIRVGDGRSFVEIGRYDAAGEARARIGVRADELDVLGAAIAEVRRLLRGHPRHDAKEQDDLLRGGS